MKVYKFAIIFCNITVKVCKFVGFFFAEVSGFLLMKLLWGRSKKKERGIRGWWGKKKEKGEDIQRKQREEENGKRRYLEICEKKKKKNFRGNNKK